MPDALDALLQSAYRYAYALTHDRLLAQDLVQDACLSLSRRGGPWRIGYLITAIRNRYIDHYRRGQVVPFQPLEDLEDVPGEPPSDAFADETLYVALDLLKPTERELLYLSVVEEYSAAEIARLTGRPRGTVLSAIHRAKQKLRRLLSGKAARRIL
jgi:RNA polymerase sigma-70 factor (ECF subfamily)